MRTAEEMYQYCIDNGFGRGFTKNRALKHFKVIEKHLRDDEDVKMTFIGLLNYVSTTDHGNNYAFAITDKRIIFGQKKVFGENVKSVVLNQFNDVSSSTGLVMGKVIFDTLGETFNVGVDSDTAKNISDKAHEIIFDLIHEKEPKSESIDIPGEIRRFKQLSDEGIITKEEFEAKKKELLGL